MCAHSHTLVSQIPYTLMHNTHTLTHNFLEVAQGCLLSTNYQVDIYIYNFFFSSREAECNNYLHVCLATHLFLVMFPKGFKMASGDM